MPHAPHVERHFSGGAVLRDVVIGMSDGLTVPFALAAGLSSAVAATRIVITAGFAEIAAGAIAMGLGGYLAARGDAEHYESERKRELREIRVVPDLEAKEVAEIFAEFGLNEAQIEPIVQSLRERPDAWVDFMMRFELGLDRPDPKRAISSALTISMAYVAGGLVPLAPYIAFSNMRRALLVSATVTLIALIVFGWVKGHFAGTPPGRSALQTAFVGGLAAAAAFALAKVFA